MALDLISASNDYIQIGIWSFDDKPYAESSDVGNTSGWGLNNNWRNIVSEIGKVHTGLEITGRAAEPAHLSGKAGLWFEETGPSEYCCHLKHITEIEMAGNNKISFGNNGNVYIGTDVRVATSVDDNIFIGRESGNVNVAANDNICIGSETGQVNEGGGNIFVGDHSGKANTTGWGQVFIGWNAGRKNVDGNNNIFIGRESGQDNITGDYNVFIGHKAGYSNVTTDGNVFIGNQAGYNETTSNKLYIANSNTVTPLIYGEFDNSKLIINNSADLAQLAVQPTGGTDLAIATTKYVGDNSIGNVVDDTTPQLGGNLDTNGHNINRLLFNPVSELTIAVGVITKTQTLHRIDTEGDAASDDLDTINGGVDGDILIIRAESDARTVVLKDGTGNLDLWSGDIELDEYNKYLVLTYDGTITKWVIAGGAGLQVVSDAVYGAGWNGVNKRAPSKNVVYDKINAMDTTIATKIANVVEDTTPQLGGDLDMNAKGIDFPTTANVTDCLDEDNMASDSATKIATQQSIKAYVDGLHKSSTDASSATPTPIGSGKFNKYTLTALAAAPTFAVPSGTPADGNKLIIRIKDNGTARALTWNAIYREGSDIAKPTTTTISKTVYCGFIYNSADSKWDLVAVTDNI